MEHDDRCVELGWNVPIYSLNELGLYLSTRANTSFTSTKGSPSTQLLCPTASVLPLIRATAKARVGASQT